MDMKPTIAESDRQYNARVLGNIIRFLQENEQYGDDFESEINVLENLKREEEKHAY